MVYSVIGDEVKGLSQYNPIPRGCVFYAPFWHPSLRGEVFKSADKFRHTLTSFGSPTWGNTGRSFNGTGNQYIEIDSALTTLDNLWDGGGSFIIWFTPSAITTIHGLWGKGANTYLWLRGSSGAGQIQLGQAFSGGNSSWRTSASGLLVNDTPVMLTVLYNADADANDPTIYLNLTQQSLSTDLNFSGTRTTDAGTNTLLAKEQNNYALNGILHENGRWKQKTLTLAEITKIYNATKGKYL